MQVGDVRQVIESVGAVPLAVTVVEGIGGAGGGPPVSGGAFGVTVSIQVIFDIAR